MRILVTGASGLLGTPLCKLALEHDHQVYSAYNQHTPLHGTPLRLNLTDTAAIQRNLKKVNPDAVIHAAALSEVDKCETEKELAWKINVEATESIAKFCTKHGTLLVYVSTDYVFNGKKGNYTETDKPNPVNYYGLTKLKGEEHVREAKTRRCIARTSVIYGAIPATGKTNFALWLIDKLRRKEEVKIITDQWNSPTLNTSLARMILEALEKRLEGTLHLAGRTRISRFEFCLQIAQEFGMDSKQIEPVRSEDLEWVAERPRDSSLNVEKATKTLINKPLDSYSSLKEMKREMQ